MIAVITGPTCSGKSGTAYELARKLGAEVINADAYKIYAGLSIGVALPSKETMGDVPRHLYSFVPPDVPYSARDFQIAFRKTVDDLLAQGKGVIVVGGASLYLKAALYDYVFPEEKKVDLGAYHDLSDEALFTKLKEIDPEEAGKLDPRNRRRVLRAIEIYLGQGRKKSEIIGAQAHRPVYPAKFFARRIARDELYGRIDERVDKMIAAGLVEEARTLLERYGPGIQAFQGIGYKELLPYFKGKISLDEATALIKRHTRNLAKRQMTFTRHQFDVISYEDVDDILRSMLP